MLQKTKSLFFLFTIFIFGTSSFANKEEIRKKPVQHQTNDFEKKEVIAEDEYNRDLEKREVWEVLKSKSDKVVIKFAVGSLIMVLIFAAFVFRSLRITRKQKSITEMQKILVEKQKRLMEIHQKEIIDSITYAWRIQQSLMPTEKYIERTLNRLNKSK